MRNMNQQNRLLSNSRGFSLLEVLLGITIFMIGMLGVTALNISSLKSNTFSGNLSEATSVAASKLEELMTQDFDGLSDGDSDGNCQDCTSFVNQDADDDGMDDDDPEDAATNVDGKPNFGLDDVGCPASPLSVDDADYCDPPFEKNNITYNVYWNVAENEPITIDIDSDPDTPTLNQRTKIITVIVEWFVKDESRRISMSTVLQKEEI